MKLSCVFFFPLLFALLWWPPEMALASSFTEELPKCRPASVLGQFAGTRSSYQFTGDCPLPSTSLLWNSEGVYDSKDGRVKERIVLNGVAPYRGEVSITMICDGDPWLGSHTCINMKTGAQGEVSTVEPLLYNMQTEVMKRKSPFTTGLPYDRGRLLAQRDADLKALAAKAEAEARAKAEAANRRLQQRTTQKQLIFVPIIQTPTAGSLFLSSTSVPIKIASPQGMAVTSYTVRLESKNAQGVWTLLTNLPVSAAEASSPSGYLGWGAAGNGRGAAMIAGPGTYRLSAQVSSPRPTAWSPWIEFVVTTPSKAIQRTPKMFGQ